jgi:hypothetical protein
MPTEYTLFNEILKGLGLTANAAIIVLLIVVNYRVGDIRKGVIKAHERLDRHLDAHQ